MDTVCFFFGCELSDCSSAGNVKMLTMSLLSSQPPPSHPVSPSPGAVIVFSKTRCR